MTARDTIQIEVAFATASEQLIAQLEVPTLTTAGKAVKLAKLSERFAEFDFDTAPIGIYGKIVSRDHLLAQNDRVEIYRSLHQAPTDARRKRANQHKRNSPRTRR